MYNKLPKPVFQVPTIPSIPLRPVVSHPEGQITKTEKAFDSAIEKHTPAPNTKETERKRERTIDILLYGPDNSEAAKKREREAFIRANTVGT